MNDIFENPPLQARAKAGRQQKTDKEKEEKKAES